MPKFEVAIYNQQVRDKVAEGDSHEYYADEWADLHFIEISAESEDHVRSQVNGRHPFKSGFIIESIENIEPSNFE